LGGGDFVRYIGKAVGKVIMSVSDDIGILAYDKAKPRVFKSLSRTRTYLFYV
jgi:hypothetical protein